MLIETCRHLIAGMIYEYQLCLLTVQLHRDALLSVLLISIENSHNQQSLLYFSSN